MKQDDFFDNIHAFSLTKLPIILGSQSPRRKQLLNALGLSFEVVVRPTEEHILHNISTDDIVRHIAVEKGRAFADMAAENLVITADTIVVLHDKILGKPNNEKEAIEMLQALSGRMHLVKTAVCLFHLYHQHCFVETTKVYFRELTEEEIAHYVKNYKPYDKAGAYGVQEWIGMSAIERIDGDFYNVMGLPTARLYKEMTHFLQKNNIT